MQIPVGLLADSLGARITVSLGMFLAGAGSVIFGFAPSSLWLFIGRFLVGIGVSTVFVSIMKIQSQWYRDSEFATISGATTLVGNAGGIFSQGPLALLISVVSWRTGFVAIGLLTVAIAALCFRFIRNRPQDIGLPPVNEREIARANLRPEPFSVVSGLKSVLSVRGILPATFFYLFNKAGFFDLIGTWGIPWMLNAYGLSVQEASSYSVILIFGIMAGGFITGWISDRLGKRKAPMLVSSVLHMVLWAVILLSENGMPPLGTLKILFFLLGITNTAFVLSWSVAKELTSEKFTGLAISILNAAGFLSIAVCTSVMGWVLDLFQAFLLREHIEWPSFFPLCRQPFPLFRFFSSLKPEPEKKGRQTESPVKENEVSSNGKVFINVFSRKKKAAEEKKWTQTVTGMKKTLTSM